MMLKKCRIYCNLFWHHYRMLNNMWLTKSYTPPEKPRWASPLWCKTPPSGRWRWPGSSPLIGLWCNWPPRRATKDSFATQTITTAQITQQSVTDLANVGVVERGVNLVEHKEGGGFIAVARGRKVSQCGLHEIFVLTSQGYLVFLTCE